MKDICILNLDEKEKWILLFEKNKDSFILLYQEAFWFDSPYKEDRSNPNDIKNALLSVFDKNWYMIAALSKDDTILWCTTIHPLLDWMGQDDLIALLKYNFWVEWKLMYACDTFVDKSFSWKWLGSCLYQSRKSIARELWFDYMVWTTSSSTDNVWPINRHKKNWMIFSEDWFVIDSAYSKAERYLMSQKL